MLILDLLAILVFGISGGLTAVRMRLDVVGVVALATVTGLGGGWIRDVLLGSVPPPALADWRYLVTPVIAGIATFFLHPAIGRMERAINVFDAFGLGLFSVAGALTASEAGLGPLPATLLGLLTGVGGGVIRDVLVGRVPTILRKGELYAVPATTGAAITGVTRYRQSASAGGGTDPRSTSRI
ncbi:MAG TPA: TRIC cation channel family protein, partial [Aeromicrobium sp.]|nr:TRIC cation channel family protein [Aeromicrobium sp.]